MSLSSSQPRSKTPLPELPVSPIRPVPALDAKPTPPHEQEKEKETAKDKPAETQPAKQPTPPADTRTKILNAALDTVLVALVAGVLAGGGYYTKTQWDKYRVPTIMELTHAQCLDLCAQREALQDAANHADSQLRMRKKLSQLEATLRQLSDRSAQLNSSIADQQNRVLALQHEIRQADKDARSVARGLLPGLPVGDVTTTRGKTYQNATITRIQGKRISLRTPEGAASFPLSELVKETLPDIVRYALGNIDLVNTADFTANGSAPAESTYRASSSAQSATQTSRRGRITVDYEADTTGPVVDTDANKTTTNVVDDTPGLPRQQTDDDVWTAPLGDLPL